MKQQIHIGTAEGETKHSKGKSLWHSNPDGKTYFCGNWYDRTPRQLKLEAESVLRDLRKEHPKLFK